MSNRTGARGSREYAFGTTHDTWEARPTTTTTTTKRGIRSTTKTIQLQRRAKMEASNARTSCCLGKAM
eukprot:10327762-Karenia_brevis.AAC.1